MSNGLKSFNFETIGFINSCFTQKFTIPRQPGLVKQAKATLKLLPAYSHPDIVRGLAQYSHVWIIFVFHKSIRQQWKNTVRPPRLGGNEKMGVFATRSNFRPNPIGQSVVKLDDIVHSANEIVLTLSGVDFLDGTPVIDIKPYVPYADSILDAKAGMASEVPEKRFHVVFSDTAKRQLALAKKIYGDEFCSLIIELLSYDSRPGYQDDNFSKIEYFSRLYDCELVWVIENDIVILKNIDCSKI